MPDCANKTYYIYILAIPNRYCDLSHVIFLFATISIVTDHFVLENI